MASAMATALLACEMQSVLHTSPIPAACITPTASPENNAWVTATSTDAAPAASSLRAACATVWHQHHLPPFERHVGQGHVHQSVTAAHLAAHGMFQPMALCRLAHPLGRFFIRAHQHRGLPARSHQI